MVKHGNFIELTVAAEMIEVSVHVDKDHRFVTDPATALGKSPIPQPVSISTAFSGPIIKLFVVFS